MCLDQSLSRSLLRNSYAIKSQFFIGLHHYYQVKGLHFMSASWREIVVAQLLCMASSYPLLVLCTLQLCLILHAHINMYSTVHYVYVYVQCQCNCRCS